MEYNKKWPQKNTLVQAARYLSFSGFGILAINCSCKEYKHIHNYDKGRHKSLSLGRGIAHFNWQKLSAVFLSSYEPPSFSPPFTEIFGNVHSCSVLYYKNLCSFNFVDKAIFDPHPSHVLSMTDYLLWQPEKQCKVHALAKSIAQQACSPHVKLHAKMLFRNLLDFFLNFCVLAK